MADLLCACLHLALTIPNTRYHGPHELRNKVSTGASKMAQRVKELAMKTDDLSSIIGAHVVEGEKTESLKVSSDLHTCIVVCVYACLVHTHNFSKGK